MNLFIYFLLTLQLHCTFVCCGIKFWGYWFYCSCGYFVVFFCCLSHTYTKKRSTKLPQNRSRSKQVSLFILNTCLRGLLSPTPAKPPIIHKDQSKSLPSDSDLELQFRHIHKDLLKPDRSRNEELGLES